MAFINLTKAFDSGTLSALWYAVYKIRCPNKCLKLLCVLNEDMIALIVCNCGSETAPFIVETGYKPLPKLTGFWDLNLNIKNTLTNQHLTNPLKPQHNLCGQKHLGECGSRHLPWQSSLHKSSHWWPDSPPYRKRVDSMLYPKQEFYAYLT